jgi:phenylpropionate dioxygenase-like ring-hydroxylating dioxygenase large terminal subunit
MVSQSENERLTRVGPGTAMGRLMREYWIPACLSSELAADGAPLRLMLLGEKLVAFRDTAGRVGLFDHRCPHRCASLFFGRNEEGGLRCVYHGWKFDVAGRCLEQPNLPPHQDFSDKVRARAYPVVEQNGLVWTYMGERETAPPLPGLEVMSLPQPDVRLSFVQRECNWLQGLEGDIDTSHFGFLHLGGAALGDVDPTNMHRFAIANRAPEYHVADTGCGTLYAAYRAAEPGQVYYRFAQFVLPFWTLIPDGTFEDNIIAGAWVPMDDTHTMTVYIHSNKRTPPLRMRKDGSPLPGLETLQQPLLPNTADWYGRFRPVANRSNDFLFDRDLQHRGSFSGWTSVGTQDQAVIETMGDIVDRRRENLAPSDLMVARTRRRLLTVLDALHNAGTVPPGVDHPELHREARSGSFVAPAGRDWLDLYRERLAVSVRAGGMPAAAE